MTFRPTLPLLAKKPHRTSKAWLARHYKDPYVKERLCNPAEYRSRSAFKLIDLEKNWGHFLSREDVRAVVDLGAAPGGWSQVAAGKIGTYKKDDDEAALIGEDESEDILQERRKLSPWSSAALKSSGTKTSGTLDARSKGKVVVAVDLLRISPIPGVRTLQADVFTPRTTDLIHALLISSENPEGKADVIMSDMAANMTGNKLRDTEASLDICYAVFKFTQNNLKTAASIGRRRGGVLLLKHFMHPLLSQFRKEHLDPHFTDVMFVKPDASRAESREGYWVCLGWKGVQSKEGVIEDSMHANSAQFRPPESHGI